MVHGNLNSVSTWFYTFKNVDFISRLINDIEIPSLINGVGN
jgi:hypothetical protein